VQEAPEIPTLFKMETTKAAPGSLVRVNQEYAFIFEEDLAFCRPIKNILLASYGCEKFAAKISHEFGV